MATHKNLDRRTVLAAMGVSGLGLVFDDQVLAQATSNGNVPPEFDFAEVLRPAALEAEARQARTRNVAPIEYSPTEPESEFPLTWAGTIALYVTKKDSAVGDEIRAAVSSRDGSDHAIAERLRNQLTSRSRMPLAEAVSRLVGEPSFGTVRLGTRTLASNLFLPAGVEACPIMLPYNGGGLPQEFTLVEHIKDETADELDLVVLRRSPPLSAVERTALRQVPRDQLDINAGVAPMCWAASAVTFAAVVSTLCGLCCPITDELLGQAPQGGTLSDDQVMDLGPAGTAKELLRIRRAILEGRTQ